MGVLLYRFVIPGRIYVRPHIFLSKCKSRAQCNKLWRKQLHLPPLALALLFTNLNSLLAADRETCVSLLLMTLSARPRDSSPRYPFDLVQGPAIP